MKTLAKYLAVSSVFVGMGLATAWAETDEQKARERKSGATAELDLHAEIASPITGEFVVGAQTSWGSQPDVGGYNGSGFLDAGGQPSDIPSGTPTNPGPSF